MTSHAQISVRGRAIAVPLLRIAGAEIVTTGRLIRIATLKDEEFSEWQSPGAPEEIALSFVRQGGRADILTFGQKVPDTAPRYDYPCSWDSAAVIRVRSYAEWLGSIGQVTRRNVRLAEKRGISVSVVPYTDDLVAGIMDIYNETPFRQGRRFWHHGKSFETVKRENGTYLDRSWFIAAKVGAELVGFVKLVRVGQVASVMQILAKVGHHERRPTNALLARAVQLCADEGLPYLKYCKYVYHRDPDDPLTVFKRRNGFEEMLLPRYHVPLTARGRVAIRLGLHLGAAAWLPAQVVHAFLKTRSACHGLAACTPRLFPRA